MPTLRLVPNHFRLTVVSLRIHGDTHYFIVDTGATRTHLAPTLLRDLRQSRVTYALAMSASDSRQVSIVHQQFNFCGVSITSFVVDDFIYKSGHDLDRPVSGLIGQDLLRQFRRVTIDYVEETITFTS